MGIIKDWLQENCKDQKDGDDFVILVLRKDQLIELCKLVAREQRRICAEHFHWRSKTTQDGLDDEQKVLYSNDPEL